MTAGKILFGLVLIILGVLLIMDNIGWIDLDFGIIWPLIIIFAGLFIILRGIEDRKIVHKIRHQGETLK